MNEAPSHSHIEKYYTWLLLREAIEVFCICYRQSGCSCIPGSDIGSRSSLSFKYNYVVVSHCRGYALDRK